jgi:glycosyltransferase involved in cell wall biosynthesis
MAEGRFIDGALRAGKRAWRKLAPQSLRRYAQPLVGALSERRVWDALASPEPAHQPGPLVVSGLISETKGVSEAARLTLAGLRAAGYSPFAHDLRPLLDAGPGARAMLPVDRPGGVWITHVNAPDAIHALAYLDPATWRGRYRIGYWAWELSQVPSYWVRASSAFHEIWAPSRFVADAIAASGIKIPVRIMPHPVALGPAAAAPDRAAFQIPASDFVALALGDLRSSAARKNLIGAIDIFAKAFPSAGRDAARNARLIVKVQSEDAHPGFRAAAEKAAGGRADIVFLADSLPTGDMRRLIASCDVVLSPHRSEGFGLPLAEAFLFGVPALATGWSGNLDFMGGIPELLIRHTLVPVRDPFGVYRAPCLSWAEPDVADGAAKLAALAASPDLRRKLAEQGRAAVQVQLTDWSPERLRATALGRFAD